MKHIDFIPHLLCGIEVGDNGCTMVAKFPKTQNKPWNIRNNYTTSSPKRKTISQNTVLIIEWE